jgi:hypothetical protein
MGDRWGDAYGTVVMRRREFLTSFSALVVGSLAPATGFARRLFPADVTDRFVARQGDDEIGRQQFSFQRQSGRFVVDARLEMRFRLSGKGTISYYHESREIWDTGWLHGLASETRIDGQTQRVHAERDHGTLRVEHDGDQPFQLSTYVVPSNLWHRDTRLVDTLIDVENGSVRLVRPRFAGKEEIRLGDRVVEASHYTIRGQLDRDAWYDPDCALVRWDLPLIDGGWISFQRDVS